jgi:hypothetical protein
MKLNCEKLCNDMQDHDNENVILEDQERDDTVGTYHKFPYLEWE